jgi:dihydrofolate synthase/folylpolyglutamate synthase
MPDSFADPAADTFADTPAAHVSSEQDPGTPRPAHDLAEAEEALLSRWPESKLDPTLERIAAFTELLGDPQRAYPVVHVTGTNGKTSTARMVDTLLRALDLRTGRFTSPHLESITERICIDGEPMAPAAFVDTYNEVAPYLALVDGDGDGHPVSFFETVVAMAFAAFADAPVDAAVVEVGMGGTWDATNVADGTVAVLLPVSVDHARYLGERPEVIAVEKAGIIKPGATVVTATQLPEVWEVIAARAAEVGASMVREGADFGVAHRVPAVGGQMLRLSGLRGEYDEVFLPLYGAHQAQNAAVALATVEAFLPGERLDAELVRAAFAKMTSPGRLEIIRRSPTIVLDAAHNPHGAAAVAEALNDSFVFSPLIGVVGVMADKDYEGMLQRLEPVFAEVVCTQNSSDRAMPADELAKVAAEVFGGDRVHVAARLDEAIDRAAALAEAGGGYGETLGSGGVLVTGSVVTVGEARTMLGSRPS